MANKMHIKQQLSRLSPLTVSIVVLFAAVMTYLLFQAFAASGVATLYTSPSGSKSVTKGQSFTISVRVATPNNAPVTGASVYLTYPSNLLQVTGESYSGSAYNTQLLANNSGGVLRMDRAAFPAISGGDKLFAQVSFKAVATGSASIGFNSSSIVTSGEDDSNILGQRSGVSYKITSASSTPAKTTSSGSSTSKNSSSNSSPTSNNTDNSQNSPSTPSDSQKDSSTSTPAKTEEPTSKPPSSTDNEVSSSAYDFSVKVVDQQNNPIVDAEVTIGSQTVKTDKNGIAKFQNLLAGKQNIAINYKGNKTFATGEVKSASTSEPDLTQPFTVKINSNKSNPLIFILPPVLILALVALSLFLRPRLMASKSLQPAINTPPGVKEQPKQQAESILSRLKSPEVPQPGSSFKPEDIPTPGTPSEKGAEPQNPTKPNP